MQLKDRFGRVHDYLRLSLIDKCNLRCTYCMPENIRFLPRKHLMSKTEILDIAGLFVREMGVNKIRITGGEPLLHPDAVEILDGLGELGAELAITTNGILLPEFLPQLKRLGLKSLNLSLDTLQPDRFFEMTRRAEFESVIEALDKSLASGLRVKLNMVVIRGQNTDELLDFVAMTKDRDIHVRFIEFMPFDGNGWRWNKVFSYREMMDVIQGVNATEKLVDRPHSTAKAYRVPGHMGTFSVISSITDSFCGSCNRIRLTADGKLRNCLFSQSEMDLLAVYRSGGDVVETVQKAILNKHEKLGGLPEFEDEEAVRETISKRSMVKIGG